MKPIFITEEDKERLIQEFSNSLKLGMYDGAYTFSKSFIFSEKDHHRATVIYTPDAFAKTVLLLSKYDSEVAWHATIRRGPEPGDFIVDDIIVYPQEVTGATVNTKDEEYTKFMCDITDEQAQYLHAQCHSHVNMATSPSATDKQHQEKLLQMLNGQGFYLFQIWNKKLEVNSFLYDFDNNVMYESKDIDIEIVDMHGNFLSDFLDESKKLVTTKVTSYTSGNYGSSSYNSGSYGGSSYKSYGSSSYNYSDNYKSSQEDKSKSHTKKKRRLESVVDDIYWDDELNEYVDMYGNLLY